MPSKLPSWLHRKLPVGGKLETTKRAIREGSLYTVCEEAKCPNRSECYSNKTATFLAMGKACTRACSFCDIDFNRRPPPPSPDEPERIARSVHKLGLKHAVITMVARDDLPDYGSSHMGKIVQAIHALPKPPSSEVLTSDFDGDMASLNLLLNALPTIFNHNMETVERLTPQVRHRATYSRSLSVLEYAAKHKGQSIVKSGIMVGLGEEKEEVHKTIRDLYNVGCQAITIGQYLQASPKKRRVHRYVKPEQFAEYAEYGQSIGITYMYSAPFVRSSYNADMLKEEMITSKK
ncbi:MAG: lipoyl synthase [Chlamydiota bacterium]|nr:lipoyl synthase [Chlamydiota bacterium]